MTEEPTTFQEQLARIDDRERRDRPMIRVLVVHPRTVLSVISFVGGQCVEILLCITEQQAQAGAAWSELARLTANALTARRELVKAWVKEGSNGR